jgi:DNA adenine methylase
VNRYLDIVPTNFGRYIEPFLGSGALFFALQPREAILSDLNPDLVETFSAIKEQWESVRSILRRYHRLHSKTFYYQVRESRPRSPQARAARFIYLNRTCWNGLYRVNLRGDFNVPIGTKDKVILDTDNFGSISNLLKAATFVVSDFEPIIHAAGRGDLVFADPPYVTAHSQNGFLKYNEKLFSWADQVRLVECLECAKKRGAQIVATNADTPSIRSLYARSFTIRAVTRPSVIAASSLKRGVRSELVVTSW